LLLVSGVMAGCFTAPCATGGFGSTVGAGAFGFGSEMDGLCTAVAPDPGLDPIAAGAVTGAGGPPGAPGFGSAFCFGIPGCGCALGNTLAGKVAFGASF
jgi:hypothetical protein